MKKKYISKPGVAVLILAGLLFIYAVWSFIQCQTYISSAVASGQLSVSGNEYDIVNFYMSNSMTYIIFAVLLSAAGLLLQKLPVPAKEKPGDMTSNAFRDKDPEELDDWFDELRRDKD